MNRRYLFGPVSAAFADQNLHRARQAGECLAFDAAGATDLMIGPADSWDMVCQRWPAGWVPDFLVLYLPYTTIPPALWAAPVPIIGLAADWNLLWHSYRHCLPACDLVLTDVAGVQALARQGLNHARAATLFGCERAFLKQPIGDRPRDIDVLFVGNLHPAVQGERLPWLGRLAALSERWHVVIEQGVFGAAYRELLGRARIVFNRGIRGEANKRAFEAAAAGALLFQEEGNLETPTYFGGGRECVYYNAENLERLLEYYLDHEEERRQLAEAARQRVQRYSFADLWEEHLATIDCEWDNTVQRCRTRAEKTAPNDLLGRTWQALSAADGMDPALLLDLAGGLARDPKCASLHNALGLVTALGGRGGGPITSQVAEQAAGYFRRALACDANHVVAGLNLAETLVALDHSAEAIDQARRMLAILDEAKSLDADVWDSGHFPPAFDHFRVEWERAAWQHARDPGGEEQAKRKLLRWRLHSILADVTGEIHHSYEAALARPDLPLSQAALGGALARAGKPEPAIPHLRQALDGNPFDRDTARALFEALGATGDGLGQRRLARERRLLHRVAPHVLSAEPAYERVPPVGDELASILILCHNQLDYTRLCLDSILRYTRPAYELVLVDNASTDGTPACLDEFARLAGTTGGPERVVVLRNEANRGFAAGCNQALAAARGRYLVFLNNDTVVTEGWLDGLVSWALHDWPHVGLVGPMSNHAPAPQQAAADYLDLDGLPAFARWHRQDHAGKGMHVPRLTGFCLLARREVLEQVGGLDESYGIGFFEDDDLCIRAAKAGFGLVLAQDVFIHHFGNRTFAGMSLDVERILRDNFGLFKAKWGPEHTSHYQLPSANGTAPKLAVSGRDPEADIPACVAVRDAPLNAQHSPLATRRQRVGLTMIVRNEEQNLPACLDSVMDLVDEAVIVDTGSTDRTKEIAARYGAKVIDFPWVDSFAAARNASLAHLTAEWALMVDADDRLDAENRDRLRKLIAGLHPEMAAFVFKCLCPPDPETGNATVVDHVRLFPSHPGVRWKFRVHEQVLPSLRRLGAVIRWSDVVIHHTGYLDPALQAGKRERNLRLLRLEEKDNPDHPFTLFNLGCLHQDMKRPDKALGCFRRSLERSQPRDSIVRKLYALIAACHRQMNQPGEALSACQAGRRYYPDDAELLFQEGLARRTLLDVDGAIACFEQALVCREAAHFGSVAVGLQGYKARQNLAVLYAEQGRMAEAEAMHRAAMAEQLRH